MLVTFGLERLEAGLNRDTVSATDVAKFLDQAEAGEVTTLARDGMGHALDRLNSRLAREAAADARPTTADQAGLPLRQYAHQGTNTQFQRTRHAYRV